MVKQTAGKDILGKFAPEFARLNDDVLFGEVWVREDKLPLKLRSVVTVSALIGMGIVDSSLKYHIELAKKNGVAKAEMAEILTHIAFYAGWPNAWAAFNLAKEVYAGEEKQEHGGFFGQGELNTAYAKYFIGKSYLKKLTEPEAGIQLFNVTFEPGCRNNWHVHNAKAGGGQMLICVDGEGWYQQEGMAPRALKPGDIVSIPAGAKHWHGARKSSWFSHIAFDCPGTETYTEWLEQVADEAYLALE